VEETLNALLDAEADRLCKAQRYERSAARRDTRAGHYGRKLQTLNIDPIPVALQLWQHTRADGKWASPREVNTQAQHAKMPDMSAQDRKHEP
jgi:hypothetical protein